MAPVSRGKQNEADPTNHLRIEYRRIDELKPDPRNPRRHGRQQITRLSRSIEAFGFVVPALVDRDGHLIAGHARILACCELGWSEIPTVVIDNLSAAKRRALMIADNRLSEHSRWDQRLLAEQFRDLSLGELDFSIEVTGFELAEIELKIAGLETQPGTKDPDDALPASFAGPSVTRSGDLWLLGNHRVLCGSVLDRGLLQTLIGDERAAMVFTEPRYDDAPSDEGSSPHPVGAIASDKTKPTGFSALLAIGLCNHVAVCRAGALFYVSVDWRHLADLLAAAREAEVELRDLCVWVKDKAKAGSFYRSQHELICVFQTGGGDCQQIKPPRNGGRRDRSNVWRHPEVAVSRKVKTGEPQGIRSRMRPVALVADAIIDCTEHGDIVLDGHLGAGTTLIAAEGTGRRCFGVERDPAQVDRVIRRWQKLTGGLAQHSQTGRSFDDPVCMAEATDAR